MVKRWICFCSFLGNWFSEQFGDRARASQSPGLLVRTRLLLSLFYLCAQLLSFAIASICQYILTGSTSCEEFAVFLPVMNDNNHFAHIFSAHSPCVYYCDFLRSDPWQTRKVYSRCWGARSDKQLVHPSCADLLIWPAMPASDKYNTMGWVSTVARGRSRHMQQLEPLWVTHTYVLYSTRCYVMALGEWKLLCLLIYCGNASCKTGLGVLILHLFDTKK